MRKPVRDPMKHIDALPESARRDLLTFIEKSAGLPGPQDLNESDYLEAILAFRRQTSAAN